MVLQTTIICFIYLCFLESFSFMDLPTFPWWLFDGRLSKIDMHHAFFSYMYKTRIHCNHRADSRQLHYWARCTEYQSKQALWGCTHALWNFPVCVFVDVDKADFIESRRWEVLCRLRCWKEKSTYMDRHICVSVSVSVPEDSNVQNILNKIFYNLHNHGF